MAAKLVNRKCLLLIQVLVSFLILVIVPAAFALPLKRLKSLTVIKEVNREGPYLGLLTVSTSEDSAFFATGAFQPHKTHPIIDLSGYLFIYYYFIMLVFFFFGMNFIVLVEIEVIGF